MTLAESPSLMRSEPADGTTNLPTDLGALRFHFSREMNPNSHSCCKSPLGEFPPLLDDGEAPWRDSQTFELKLMPLTPGTTYAIQLNSEKRKGFRSAADNEPLPVTTIRFTTAAAPGTASPHPGKSPDEVSCPPADTPADSTSETSKSLTASPDPATEIFSQSTPPASSGPTDSSGADPRSVRLFLYLEEYQGAFSMLLPKGWQAEGGMIPSGVPWNIVDITEGNIRFRATRPDGKAVLGFYPRFYYQDPASMVQSSGGYLRPQTGSTLNGCWLYPYMTIQQYVETIVFGRFSAQEFLSPRILGPVVEVAELRAFVPQTAQHYQAGYVNFECVFQGEPAYGRVYVVVYLLMPGYWTTAAVYGFVVPKAEWKEGERLMEYCLRTFRLDPQWLARAQEGANRRTAAVADLTRKINADDVQWQQRRMQSLSDRQTEFYKVLTGQIEARDPQTGQVHWLPSYNNAYSNGQGEFLLSDKPLETTTDWHPMKIINRTE